MSWVRPALRSRRRRQGADGWAVDVWIPRLEGEDLVIDVGEALDEVIGGDILCDFTEDKVSIALGPRHYTRGLSIRVSQHADGTPDTEMSAN